MVNTDDWRKRLANPSDCDCRYVHCSSSGCRSKALSRGAVPENKRQFPADPEGTVDGLTR